MGVGAATALLAPLLLDMGEDEGSAGSTVVPVALQQGPVPEEDLPRAGALTMKEVPGAVAVRDEGSGAVPASSAGSAMGGDLPTSGLPSPAFPRCPTPAEGNWWTDPADPYTCLPPVPVPFHEPTPPGMPPELLQPIDAAPTAPGVLPVPVPFHEPTPPGMLPELLQPIDAAPTAPIDTDDCRVSGAMQCTVTIMGQAYVIDFVGGEPVAVSPAE
ncbi:hypothetical protein E8P82_05815 [Arthrobacter echini]|uniref:Uncharacterized protein n=1 Tax=Arthrobacter echini TaxID=1529066 RepID=A0A4S5E6A4_9MICC|nr:hypothetical protein [Arthrobacter echini]THJ66973.1 hypothetical protein E8P82_05815 [Arthrobacter echini]